MLCSHLPKRNSLCRRTKQTRPPSCLTPLSAQLSKNPPLSSFPSSSSPDSIQLATFEALPHCTCTSSHRCIPLLVPLVDLITPNVLSIPLITLSSLLHPCTALHSGHRIVNSELCPDCVVHVLAASFTRVSATTAYESSVHRSLSWFYALQVGSLLSVRFHDQMRRCDQVRYVLKIDFGFSSFPYSIATSSTPFSFLLD